MTKNTYIKKKRKNEEHHMNSMQKSADDFLDNLRIRKYQPTTITNRQNSMNKFISFLDAIGVERFQEVTRLIMDEYRLFMVDSKLAFNTVELHLRAARRLFTYLEENSQLFENPTREMRLHKHQLTLGPVLTEKEAKKLLASCDLSTKFGVRNRAIIEFLYSTGVRLEEAASLTIFDIDFNNRSVRVLGKGRKERVLPLGKHALYYLEKYMRFARQEMIDSSGETETNALWLSNKRIQLTKHGITRMIEEQALKAGIVKRVSTHTLRRTCATHLLRNGAHPFVVAELLGHAELRTLSHYLKISITDLMKTHKKSRPGK